MLQEADHGSLDKQRGAISPTSRRLLTCDLEERQLLVGGNILKVDESLDVQVDLVLVPWIA
jgi:hypothetical protein